MPDSAMRLHKTPDGPAYHNRAVTHETKGRIDLAIADYRSTLAIEPGDRNGRDGLKRISAAR